MTTRAPRPDEVEGESYFFVDRSRFEEAIANGELFEYTEVYGAYYGTPKAPVFAQLEKGIDVILEIEINGAMQVRKAMHDAVLIFIMPPSFEDLKNRIESRGTETPEHIAHRLARAESEIARIGDYDYCVVNDELEVATADVGNIIRAQNPQDCDVETMRRAEGLRVGRHAEEIIERYKTGGSHATLSAD
jgi:guanylate kinase